MDEKQFPEQDESQSSFEEAPDISIQQEPDTIPEPITPDEEFPGVGTHTGGDPAAGGF